MDISVANTQHKLSIVHINTHDIAGGAAKVAWRLSEEQRNFGHDSKMLVGVKMSDSENSTSFPPIVDPVVHAQCKREGQLFYEFQGSHHLVNHPLIQSADILHLHNLHGWYFNPFSLSPLSRQKPVIWTLHDMQSLTGHCAHSFDCERWKIGCESCPYLNIEHAISVDTAGQLLRDKQLIYNHSCLQIVTPSQWLKKKVEQSILQKHPVELIYNGIDIKTFRPHDKKEVRKQFGIPEDIAVIGAVAHGGSLANQWKGGQYTQAALEALWEKQIDYIFVNIGANYKSDNPKILNIPPIHSEQMLARAYSALDIFLYTPIADNCPLVVLEALACGVPIVTFNTGGVPELVRDGADGFVVEYKNTASLVNSLIALIHNAELRQKFSLNARQKAEYSFDHELIARKYEILYSHVIDRWDKEAHKVKPLDLSQVPSIVKTESFIAAQKTAEIGYWTELNKQGAELFAKDDIQGALNAFIKAIEINPNFAGAHNNLAILYWQTGQPQKAADLFSRALQIDPNDLNTVLNCIELLKFHNRIEDAKALCASFLQRHPGDEAIGKALKELKRITEYLG